MEITFFSNYLNHHQLPLANAFNRLPGVNFNFIATTPFNEKRREMGYQDINERYDFVLRSYEGEKQEKLALSLARSSDIVIIGSAPDRFMVDRLAMGKTTFHASERFFKNGISIRTFPKYFASALKHIRPYQNMPLYYLCASAYTAKDVNAFASYSGKCFKWGYFTEVIQRDEIEIFKTKKDNECPIILWVGRFLKWKHPDTAIRLANRLIKNGYRFHMQIIGGGELEKQLKSMVHRYHLEDVVSFFGFQPPENVINYMKQADIFLFTSDSNEGWGAVLNEAMSNSCASIASHASGAAPFLINDGVNGFLYHSEDEDELFEKAKILLNDEKRRRDLGIQSYRDMIEIWSPGVAAERLIKLNEAIMNKTQLLLFDKGPCSPAPILDNRWY